MILPLGKVAYENLNTSFTDFSGFLEDLKANSFTGYVRVSFWQYDGAVFMSPPKDADPDEEHIIELIDSGLTVVFINRAWGTFPVCEVFSDHQFGIYSATASLLAQGRNRVGLVLGRSRSEPAGYLACCQGANGVIHLISSRLHHAFNLAWLQTPPPAQD